MTTYTFVGRATPAGAAIFSVVLEKIIHPNGRESTILMREKFLDGLCTSYAPDNSNFGKILGTIYEDPNWFIALNDLIEAVALPHVGPRNCGRALEIVRNMISGKSGTGDRKSAWRKMHEQLNLGDTYTRLISDHSKDARHGNTAFIPFETGAEIKRRTWVIMDRFIHWRLRGSQKLPASDFPFVD